MLILQKMVHGLKENQEMLQYSGMGKTIWKDPVLEGFELFASSPVRKVEKAEQSSGSKSKDEKLQLEPLDLSLSLPNVLLPIGATGDSTQAPGSPKPWEKLSVSWLISNKLRWVYCINVIFRFSVIYS
ncbi:hypothetical protein OIU76_014931 [Salix suchowensis]|nr:hypothetical protein OIU76_014931 [Salix suchowensis]